MSKQAFEKIAHLLLAKQRIEIQNLRDLALNSLSFRLTRLWLQVSEPEVYGKGTSELSVSNLAYQLPKFTYLQKDPEIQKAACQATDVLGLPLFACLLWLESTRLQIRYPLPLRRRSYLAWWNQYAPSHYVKANRVLEASALEPDESRLFYEKDFGVNLVGHARSIFGLGEYLRMMAKALQAASIPFCVWDIPSENGANNNDVSLQAYLAPNHESLPYAFTIYCMTAVKQLELALKTGLTKGLDTYSISCWFWEMERWPDSLALTLELANEFWPCTKIIETALRSTSNYRQLPVIRIPPVVELGNSLNKLPSRNAGRDFHGLDRNAVLFVFSFDLNSSIHRKNPQAAIEAFQLAFGVDVTADAETRVGLVIKCFPPVRPEPLWKDLKELAARDSRIKIIEASLDREALLALFSSCDCFLSLHRSEGLGLGPAEALQLGLDVIATDYGGNTDFCTGPLAHPVPYHLIPVQKGEYAYHEGLRWAEPDIGQAAILMQKVARKRQEDDAIDPAVIEEYKDRFSASRIGNLYRQRLEELWARRDAIQAQLDES